MQFKYIEKNPTPDEYNKLRELVGWGTYENAIIEKSLPKSLYSGHYR